MPTIQVDLASPQSPDSINLMDEFRAAKKKKQQEEEDQGLTMTMRSHSGARGPNMPGEADREQKMTRCLSDPGPSADEDEDEPFLP